MNSPFEKLREQLALQEWPDVYLFKFIVSNEPEMLARAMGLFSDTAEVTLHESKNGNYVSISAKEVMTDVDSIIERYERAAEIKGMISL